MATVNSLNLPECVVEFERLKKMNAKIMGCAKARKPAPKRKQTEVSR